MTHSEARSSHPAESEQPGSPWSSSESQALARGRVERLDGWNDTRYVPTLTWRTYLDGELLGNACDEAEGWRWITDMLRLEARNA